VALYQARVKLIIDGQMVGKGLFSILKIKEIGPTLHPIWLAGHAKYFDRLSRHETGQNQMISVLADNGSSKKQQKRGQDTAAEVFSCFPRFHRTAEGKPGRKILCNLPFNH